MASRYLSDGGRTAAAVGDQHGPRDEGGVPGREKETAGCDLGRGRHSTQRDPKGKRLEFRHRGFEHMLLIPVVGRFIAPSKLKRGQRIKSKEAAELVACGLFNPVLTVTTKP